MKITFTYSPQLEAAISKRHVSPGKSMKTIRQVSHIWKKEGHDICRKLRDVTGLNFKKNEIICYINSKASFSDPLALRISNDPKVMIDNLVHELIHVLLTQNIDLIWEKIQRLHETYKSHSFTTRIHILIHAVHLELAKELFPDRIRSIRTYAHDADYRLAWKIVIENGSQALVKNLLNP